MRILNRSKRIGFTLLEMIIALSLGMVLLLGLYMTLNITVNLAQTGREVMTDGAAARSVMARINADISNQVGPIDPRVLAKYGAPTSIMTTPGGTPLTNVFDAANAFTESTESMTTPNTTSQSTSGSSGTTNSASGGSGTTKSASGGSGTTNSASGSSGASQTGSSGTAGSNTMGNGQPAVLFNIGVRGDATSLILSVYRVQRPPVGQPTNVPDPIVISDVSRVNYWLITNGSDTVGLARQEIKQATSLDIDLALTDIANPNQYLISDEVKNILFEYFDGTTWQPTWDGSTLGGPMGNTPIGPPVAIRVTLTLRRNTKQTETISDYPDDATNTYVHVIPLPTSNNPAPRMAITATN
jgi:hypothetical protein